MPVMYVLFEKTHHAPTISDNLFPLSCAVIKKDMSWFRQSGQKSFDHFPLPPETDALTTDPC
jgi:hypothetical protein